MILSKIEDADLSPDGHFDIPTGVTKIGDRACENCKKLETIKLHDGITEIGESAFSSCENLKEVIIPPSVMKIGEGAFVNCKKLEILKLHDGITEIGAWAFWGCENLKEVIIPASVTMIGRFAFQNCTMLETLKLHDRITEIGEGAFWECKNLKEVIIPASVTKISKRAFENCTMLETLKLHDGITEIGESAFWGCKNLKEVIIPASVTKIGRRAFMNCTMLETLKLHDGITEIGEGAFWGCENLKEVIIPTSVTVIESYVFPHGSKLTSIIIDDSRPEEFARIKDLLQKNLRTKVLPKFVYDKAVSIREAALKGFCQEVDISALCDITKALSYDVLREISSFEGLEPYWALKDALTDIQLPLELKQEEINKYQGRVQKTLDHHISLAERFVARRVFAGRLKSYIAELEKIVEEHTGNSLEFFKGASPKLNDKIYGRYHFAQKLIDYLENSSQKLFLSESDKVLISGTLIETDMPVHLKEELDLVQPGNTDNKNDRTYK